MEIIEQVFYEIKSYGHDQQKNKLIAGIVLTGGGSQLKHLKQVVEYITGMDTRIGYPNEHLAGDSSQEISSPLYATAVGLVMDGLDRFEREGEKFVEQEEEIEVEDFVAVEEEVVEQEPQEYEPIQEKKSFLIS